jgi:hypothetical protein
VSSKFPRISDAAINAVSFLNKSNDPAQNYAACVIGTSMVKQIKPSELFGDKKCFFKSINGGLINDIARCLVARDLLLESDGPVRRVRSNFVNGVKSMPVRVV